MSGFFQTITRQMPDKCPKNQTFNTPISRVCMIFILKKSDTSVNDFQTFLLLKNQTIEQSKNQTFRQLEARRNASAEPTITSVRESLTSLGAWLVGSLGAWCKAAGQGVSLLGNLLSKVLGNSLTPKKSGRKKKPHRSGAGIKTRLYLW